MIFSMDNEVLLDTNIILRLMEDNPSMIKNITAIKNDGYNFSISDMTLFELLDNIKTTEAYFKLLNVLYDYNVRPIYKDKIPEFGKLYKEWFKRPTPLNELKEQLFPSFSSSLATVLTDLAKAIMLFLANKLTTDYSSEFYNSVVFMVNEMDTKHFERVIKHYYFSGESLRKRLLLEYKDLVIRELTYFNLLQKSDTYEKAEFTAEYNAQDLQHKGQTFQQICAEILTEKDLLFNVSELDDKMDQEFITTFLSNLLCKNRKFEINDVTDYINFKYSYKFCAVYFTTDGSSLKKYEDYFEDKNIRSYLERSIQFIKKYSKNK